MKESTIKVVRDERGRFAKKDILGNFKVGDRIRLLEKHWAVTSRCPAGTIAKIERKDGEGSFWCSPIPGYPKGFAFSPCPAYADSIELINDTPSPTPRPFKVGDVVRLSADGKRKWPHEPYNPHDAIGRVIEFYNYGDGLGIRVKWNNDKTNSYAPLQLELVPNTPKQRKAEKKAEAPKFKIGDMVTGVSNLGENETGTVIAVDPWPHTCQTYRIRCNRDGAEVWMKNEGLSLVNHVSIDLSVPEEIPAALQTLAKAFGYRVEKA